MLPVLHPLRRHIAQPFLADFLIIGEVALELHHFQIALEGEDVGGEAVKKDRFDSGRGLLVRQNAVAALAPFHAVLGLDPTTLRLHKEDTCTDHNCPGKHVNKSEVIKDIQALLRERHGGDHGFPKDFGASGRLDLLLRQIKALA